MTLGVSNVRTIHFGFKFIVNPDPDPIIEYIYEGEVIDSSEGMSDLFNMRLLARCLLKRDWVMFPRPNGSMETSRA